MPRSEDVNFPLGPKKIHDRWPSFVLALLGTTSGTEWNG